MKATPMSDQSTAETDDITLEQWVVLERLRLDEFVAFWRNGQAGHNTDGTPADAFPSCQPVGEWDEQYLGWSGMENDDARE